MGDRPCADRALLGRRRLGGCSCAPDGCVVIGGIVIVALVELLSDSVLDPILPFPLDTIAVVAVMATVASLGAVLAFRRLDHDGSRCFRNATRSWSRATRPSGRSIG